MGLFDFLFGKPKTPAQMVRDSQRLLSKAIRNVEKEKLQMELQEKKLLQEIKAMAKSGHMGAVKIMANDLIRTRASIRKFMLMKANIQAVAIKVTTLNSQHALGEAMVGVTKAIRLMNQRMRVPRMQCILREFERQAQAMGVKEEIINDSAMGFSEDDEEESDTIVQEVMDELGLEMKSDLVNVPDAGKFQMNKEKPKVAEMISQQDVELEERLNNLRRDDL